MSKGKHIKTGVISIIFGRTTFVVLSILFQILILLGIINWFSDYVVVAYSSFIMVAVVGTIVIYNREVNADYKLAWMVPVVIAPVFGVMFYIFMSLQYGTRYIEKELVRQKKSIQEIMPEKCLCSDEDKGFFNYMYDCAMAPVYSNNEVEYFGFGQDKFEELILQLKKAEKFIFMEYFIVDKGYMWDTILEVLKEKAKSGVEVRFMYDGMCSLVLLPYRYPKELSRYGIKSKMFSPIHPILSTYQNNRDHRKIVVIDGKVAFTGGVNLADEYINRIEKFGYWKDSAVMVTGPCVKSFTMMFLQMWNVGERLSEDYKKYIVQDEDITQEVQGLAMPYGDEPYDGERVGKQVYLHIINNAHRYVHIMTPYLILDDEMRNALIYCAKRGVETVIIMPHIPDKRYAYYLARTYYPELISNGVKIYEYEPGFVHAKVFVSDDKRATVGSINMDFRSMYLHFECGLYMQDSEIIGKVEKDFQDTLKECIEITYENCRKYPLLKRIAGRGLRLIAPLM